jgi:hypothetical protein
MTVTSEQIEGFAESRFEGLTREQLRECGKILGADFGPNTAERTMRVRLCELYGTIPTAEVKISAPKAPVKSGRFDPKPALNADAIRSDVILPNGKRSDGWQGRRHRVNVHPPGAENENPRKYFQLTWEGAARVYPYGKDLDLPYPLYQNLKDSKRNHLIEREIRNERNEVIRIDYDDNWLPRYHFNDIGPTPGTEHLPTSLRDYWATQAAKHGNFSDLVGQGQSSRRTLIQIRSELYEAAGPAFYRDLTDQDILTHIHEALNIDEYAEAA